MIPALQSVDLFRPIADEDAEIMKPRCRKDNVVIVSHSFADLPGESVEPGLMAELVYGTRFFFDDAYDCAAKILCHAFILLQHPSIGIERQSSDIGQQSFVYSETKGRFHPCSMQRSYSELQP
jgi:hypothetical protein